MMEDFARHPGFFWLAVTFGLAFLIYSGVTTYIILRILHRLEHGGED